MQDRELWLYLRPADQVDFHRDPTCAIVYQLEEADVSLLQPDLREEFPPGSTDPPLSLC